MFLVKWFSGTPWLFNLITFVTGCAFIVNLFFALKKWIRRKRYLQITKNMKDFCALSIGFGKNDPKEAVLEFIGKDKTDKLLSKRYTHKGDEEAFLTKQEVQNALNDIDCIIGSLRRNNCKEVLVFCAVPMAAALQIGYMFKNFHGKVKFMQPDSNKKYIVMAGPKE